MAHPLVFDQFATAVKGGKLGREPQEISATASPSRVPECAAWYEAPCGEGRLVFAIRGDLDTPTGYVRQAHVAELRELGWRPEVLASATVSRAQTPTKRPRRRI